MNYFVSFRMQAALGALQEPVDGPMLLRGTSVGAASNSAQIFAPAHLARNLNFTPAFGIFRTQDSRLARTGAAVHDPLQNISTGGERVVAQSGSPADH